MTRTIPLMLVLVLGMSGIRAAAPSRLQLIDALTRGTVRIETDRVIPFASSKSSRTGFVVGAGGLIATASSVDFENDPRFPPTITVRVGTQSFKASVVSNDLTAGIAMLHVADAPQLSELHLPAAPAKAQQEVFVAGYLDGFPQIVLGVATVVTTSGDRIGIKLATQPGTLGSVDVTEDGMRVGVLTEVTGDSGVVRAVPAAVLQHR